MICQNQIKEMQQENEELEQYGRRLCLRIHGITTVDNETSDEVLDKVKPLIKETRCDITNVVINRAYRIQGRRHWGRRETRAPPTPIFCKLKYFFLQYYRDLQVETGLCESTFSSVLTMNQCLHLHVTYNFKLTIFLSFSSL